MKHHRKLHWVFLYKNTTRGHDWLTTTTKWLTSCFALKNISETTSPNSIKLYRKLPLVTLYKNTTIDQQQQQQQQQQNVFKNISWNYHSKQEASLGDPLQKYNKGSWLINNNNEMANFLFGLKKTSPVKLPGQIHWNCTGSFIACLLGLHS